MEPEAPNFLKTWGDNLFQPGVPETSKFRGFIHIERPMFPNLGVHFCAELYRNEGANIDEMYHKSMYDP